MASIYDAVHQLESGGSTSPGVMGDGGFAYGPMQVHGPALADYNKAYGSNFTLAELSANPGTGVTVGNGYLDLMRQRFPGRDDYALGAYNQGPGAMQRAIDSGQGVAGLPNGGPAYVQRGMALLGGSDVSASAGNSGDATAPTAPPTSGDTPTGPGSSNTLADPSVYGGGGGAANPYQVSPSSAANAGRVLAPVTSALNGFGSTIAQYFARVGVAALGVLVIMVALFVMNRQTIIQTAKAVA